MKLRNVAIATSTVAFATLFSVGWSEQRSLSLSVDSAQAQVRARLVVRPNYYNHYSADITGLPFYAVRAYYTGGPWSGTYGSSGSYNGWDDYKARNGIVCTPGTLVKGGDGIYYACQ